MKNKIERERKRDRETERDRETDRQRDRQTERESFSNSVVLDIKARTYLTCL